MVGLIDGGTAAASAYRVATFRATKVMSPIGTSRRIWQPPDMSEIGGRADSRPKRDRRDWPDPDIKPATCPKFWRGASPISPTTRHLRVKSQVAPRPSRLGLASNNAVASVAAMRGYYIDRAGYW